MLKIIGFSGSLRYGSLNTSLLYSIANSLKNHVDVDFEIVSIDLPMYSGNEELSEFPESVMKLREKIEQADGLIITCPEYNWNMTVALKNAIDWLSMGGKKSPIYRKVVAIAGVGGGRLGSVRAQMAVRSTLLHNQVWVVPGPEVLIAPSEGMFDEEDNLKDNFANQLINELLLEFLRVTPLINSGKNIV